MKIKIIACALLGLSFVVNANVKTTIDVAKWRKDLGMTQARTQFFIDRLSMIGDGSWEGIPYDGRNYAQSPYQYYRSGFLASKIMEQKKIGEWNKLFTLSFEDMCEVLDATFDSVDKVDDTSKGFELIKSVMTNQK